jgi:reductive dehalogenase
VAARLFQAGFDVTEWITRDLDWEPAPPGRERVVLEPGEAAARLKGFARALGADLVGCTALDPAWVYSHAARSPGEWGREVTLDHRYAVAIAVEMDHELVRHAPRTPTATATALGYLESAKVAMTLARYLGLLGYDARAHVDGNYLVMCVPVAVDAGLGELGRHGLLIAPKMGSRLRIAVVTTDLPLAQDPRIDLGARAFCESCRKCATCCPSRSVDAGDPAPHNGIEKWQSEQDHCYEYWRKCGSDCGICIKVCPYSHPSSPSHDLVRWAIARNPLARRLALWADDLAYGAHPRRKYPWPEWHRRMGR